MSFTAGVGSAGEVLASLFTNLQIVGDAYAVRPITRNQSIRWMVKAKVFDEVLQWCVREQTQAQTHAKFLSVAQKDRPARWVTGNVTEICGRDFLNLVLRIGNSNDIPERTAMTALEGASDKKAVNLDAMIVKDYHFHGSPAVPSHARRPAEPNQMQRTSGAVGSLVSWRFCRRSRPNVLVSSGNSSANSKGNHSTCTK
jgi:hypothetical protein